MKEDFWSLPIAPVEFEPKAFESPGVAGDDALWAFDKDGEVWSRVWYNDEWHRINKFLEGF